MELSRRSLLGSTAGLAAIGLVGANLAGCTTNSSGQTVLDPSLVAALPASFLDAVTTLVAEGCTIVQKVQGYIPTATTIATDVAALFGAAAVGPGILLVANAVNAVASDLCSVVPTAPAASARFTAAMRLAKRMGSSPAGGEASAVLIGTTKSGIAAKGWPT